MSLEWRFIPFRHYNPYIKTALNKVVVDVVKKTGEPIIWLAGWKPSCVNIGYSQKIRDVINLEEVKKFGLIIVRRQGGGGAVYLSDDGEISWSIVAPVEYFPEDINKIYKRVCGRVIQALREITARHKPVNDIVTEKGKVSGVTIKKDHSVVYVGGTLLYDVDKSMLKKVLTSGNLNSNSTSHHLFYCIKYIFMIWEIIVFMFS